MHIKKPPQKPKYPFYNPTYVLQMVWSEYYNCRVFKPGRWRSYTRRGLNTRASKTFHKIPDDELPF